MIVSNGSSLVLIHGIVAMTEIILLLNIAAIIAAPICIYAGRIGDKRINEVIDEIDNFCSKMSKK